MAKTKSISVRIDAEVLEKFNKVSDRLAINRSKFIENALKAFIKEDEKSKK